MTYQQYIDLAVQTFTRGSDPNAVDSDVALTAQSLVPIVFQNLAIRYSGDERQRQLLKRTFTVAAVNGVATLDPMVLTKSFEDTQFYDPANLARSFSYLRNYSAMFGGLDERLGYYTLEYGDRVRVVLPNVPFDPTSGPTQNFSLTVAAVPEIPAAASDTLAVPDEFLSDAIEALAEALRGAPQQP